MVIAVFRFEIHGAEEDTRKSFLEQAQRIQPWPGCCGLELLADGAGAPALLLLTRWTSEAAYQAWQSSLAIQDLQAILPVGCKLDVASPPLWLGRSADHQIPARWEDALAGWPIPLCDWLVESDVVFMLLVDGEGAIQLRNPAAERIFAPSPVPGAGALLWDYLVASDAEPLKDRLARRALAKGSFRINLASDRRNPITAETCIVDCAAGFLLLGAIEQRFADRLYDELQAINNQLAVKARELSKKNRLLVEKNKVIEELSRTDALTGLANRQAFYDALEREMARTGRERSPLTLILADIDGFKSINDTYGHVVGDHVLARIGEVLAENMRPYDLAARYGGEEFAVLLTETGAETGIGVAERLRSSVSAAVLPDCSASLTMSFGVATLAAEEDCEAFVARADAALYRAKAGGGDKVESGNLHDQAS